MTPGADVDALIGFTGFVGGTVARQHDFGALYNSSNIADIRGRSFDLLVCAGVSAAKWLANKDPESDRVGIATLTGALARVEARELVLVSTIDVYDDPASGADEDGAIDAASNHAYGRHRYELEQWALDRFPNTRVVRLPALFGNGLKKNAVYDLLHGNSVENINPAGVFQWYPVRRLWDDIQTVRRAGLRIANLFTAPLPMSDIIDAFFPAAPVGPERRPAPTYDLRTKHAALFGGGDEGYVLGAEIVLGEMARFVAAERRRALAASGTGGG